MNVGTAFADDYEYHPPTLKDMVTHAHKASQGQWSWEEDGDIQKIYAGRTGFSHGANLFGDMSGDSNKDNNLSFIAVCCPIAMVELNLRVTALQECVTQLAKMNSPELPTKIYNLIAYAAKVSEQI